MFVDCAVELSPEGRHRRIRLAQMPDFSAAPPQALRHRSGRSRRPCRHRRLVRLYWVPDQVHDAKSVGRMAAHIVLQSTHRAFSNLKGWALGTFHGLRPQHLRRYLDEYVFRWDRRRHTVPASDTLLGIGARLAPATARDVVDQRV